MEIKEPITFGLDHNEIINRLNKLKGCIYIALSDETRDGIPYTLIFVYYDTPKKDSSIKNKLKLDDTDCTVEANEKTCRKNRDHVFRQEAYKKYRKQYEVFNQLEWGKIPTNEAPAHHPEYKTLPNGTKIVNYSRMRIEQILKEDFNYSLIKNYAGYKGDRNPNHRATYKLIDNTTQNILDKMVTLDSLRYMLTLEGYSLKK